MSHADLIAETERRYRPVLNPASVGPLPSSYELITTRDLTLALADALEEAERQLSAIRDWAMTDDNDDPRVRPGLALAKSEVNALLDGRATQ